MEDRALQLPFLYFLLSSSCPNFWCQFLATSVAFLPSSVKEQIAWSHIVTGILTEDSWKTTHCSYQNLMPNILTEKWRGNNRLF